MAFGLGTAFAWGVGDFIAGMQSRRFPVFTVLYWSQLAGGLVLVLAALLSGQPVPPSGILWGATAGAAGAVALLLFYRGLATGTMSIVAPISATGVVLPVFFSVLTGHVPKPIALAGIVAVVTGIVLVSVHDGSEEGKKPVHLTSVSLALGAAACFGLFYILLDQAAGTGSALWATVGARAGSLSFLTLLLAGRRASLTWPGSINLWVPLAGVLDSSANLLFALGTQHGNLAVVSVLASMYPVTTVLLSQLILKERLSMPQGAGVLITLCGVVLLSIP